ncbi:hypothetical protein PHJA_001954300 [Phtheirospermum japonicum]|uniref:Uncharacterized protein n=1 Tax=Phtheirospermum japonicum TaxID=374723 RepID=A0A830CIN0_9LAMI|nr:hypothetical protein PHJA_001954300 [Phtheirospermum japonicum]
MLDFQGDLTLSSLAKELGSVLKSLLDNEAPTWEFTDKFKYGGKVAEDAFEVIVTLIDNCRNFDSSASERVDEAFLRVWKNKSFVEEVKKEYNKNMRLQELLKRCRDEGQKRWRYVVGSGPFPDIISRKPADRMSAFLCISIVYWMDPEMAKCVGINNWSVDEDVAEDMNEEDKTPSKFKKFKKFKKFQITKDYELVKRISQKEFDSCKCGWLYNILMELYKESTNWKWVNKLACNWSIVEIAELLRFLRIFPLNDCPTTMSCIDEAFNAIWMGDYFFEDVRKECKKEQRLQEILKTFHTDDTRLKRLLYFVHDPQPLDTLYQFQQPADVLRAFLCVSIVYWMDYEMSERVGIIEWSIDDEPKDIKEEDKSPCNNHETQHPDLMKFIQKEDIYLEYSPHKRLCHAYTAFYKESSTWEFIVELKDDAKIVQDATKLLITLRDLSDSGCTHPYVDEEFLEVWTNESFLEIVMKGFKKGWPLRTRFLCRLEPFNTRLLRMPYIVMAPFLDIDYESQGPADVLRAFLCVSIVYWLDPEMNIRVGIKERSLDDGSEDFKEEHKSLRGWTEHDGPIKRINQDEIDPLLREKLYDALAALYDEAAISKLVDRLSWDGLLVEDAAELLIFLRVYHCSYVSSTFATSCVDEALCRIWMSVYFLADVTIEYKKNRQLQEILKTYRDEERFGTRQQRLSHFINDPRLDTFYRYQQPADVMRAFLCVSIVYWMDHEMSDCVGITEWSVDDDMKEEDKSPWNNPEADIPLIMKRIKEDEVDLVAPHNRFYESFSALHDEAKLWDFVDEFVYEFKGDDGFISNVIELVSGLLDPRFMISFHLPCTYIDNKFLDIWTNKSFIEMVMKGLEKGWPLLSRYLCRGKPFSTRLLRIPYIFMLDEKISSYILSLERADVLRTFLCISIMYWLDPKMTKRVGVAEWIVCDPRKSIVVNYKIESFGDTKDLELQFEKACELIGLDHKEHSKTALEKIKLAQSEFEFECRYMLGKNISAEVSMKYNYENSKAYCSGVSYTNGS